jgi:hypothetical protein
VSIRPWAAEQSSEIDVLDEAGRVIETRPVVTQDDLIKALVDAAIVLDRCGGHLGVVLKRIPGPLPGSMVTEQAIIQWQERTDAKRQPEPNALEERHEIAIVEAPQETEELAVVANGAG